MHDCLLFFSVDWKRPQYIVFNTEHNMKIVSNFNVKINIWENQRG